MDKLLLASVFLSLGACAQQSSSSVPAVAAQRALAIADEYKSYGRVDDELRWAPFLCRQPMPGVARQSASTDPGTHGQKLYSVFVKDHAAYPERSQVGQVIVKESFKAEPVTDPSSVPSIGTQLQPGSPTEDHFFPYAKKGDQYFRAGDPAGLFVMYRVDAGADPATHDEGWVYATISADKQVTASGRIDSCMGCHVEAPHGRLFGVPTSPSNN